MGVCVAPSWPPLTTPTLPTTQPANQPTSQPTNQPLQVLANRPDIVREDYMNELCVLQDDVPPFPDEQVGGLVGHRAAVGGRAAVAVGNHTLAALQQQQLPACRALFRPPPPTHTPSPTIMSAGVCPDRGVPGPPSGPGLFLHQRAPHRGGIPGPGKCVLNRSLHIGCIDPKCMLLFGGAKFKVLPTISSDVAGMGMRRRATCARAHHPPTDTRHTTTPHPYLIHPDRCTRQYCGRQARTWRSRCSVRVWSRSSSATSSSSAPWAPL